MQLPSGFRYAGVACGIKKSAQNDLTLIVADAEVTAAGVYTQNRVVAAPVVLSRQRTPSDKIRAVVINSGNANACTGAEGAANAAAMTQHVADLVNEGVEEHQILVMSTGIIGHQLPMDRVKAGIEQAFEQLRTGVAAFEAAADGILTTDRGRKVAHREWECDGATARIAGMAKGAGMIGPNMATMLGILLTDVPLRPEDAAEALKYAADRSFNRISVEGHTSTNDTLLLLSSGRGQPLEGTQLEEFTAKLTEMAIELAKQIPADGEGATHLIEIQVEGAADDDQAVEIAKTIAASALVKTAITGNDPNWGRIVSAAGYARAEVDAEAMSLEICGQAVFSQGAPAEFDEAAVSAAMRSSETVLLRLVVGDGDGSTTFWTSDLTTSYVEFNSDYST